MTRDTYPQRYEVRTPRVTMRFTLLNEARAAMTKLWRDLHGEYDVSIIDNNLCMVVDRIPASPQSFKE